MTLQMSSQEVARASLDSRNGTEDHLPYQCKEFYFSIPTLFKSLFKVDQKMIAQVEKIISRHGRVNWPMTSGRFLLRHRPLHSQEFYLK
jgi:hypothetical protein